jgi:hypothetical protein
MLLATGSSFDLFQFIRILSWILLPLFTVASLLTIYFHYRNKKRDRETLARLDEAFLHASPELLGYTRGDGEYIFFDHSPAIREYKKRLASNHAKYTALQHDYEKLSAKFSTIAAYTCAMKQRNAEGAVVAEELSTALAVEIDMLAASHAREKTELLNRFDYLSKNFQSLEQAHRSVQEKLSQAESTLADQQSIQQRLSEELEAALDENKRFKTLLQEREIHINELTATNASQQEAITLLENRLNVSNALNDSLESTVLQPGEKVIALEVHANEMTTAESAAALSAILNPDAETSPVIDLTEYINRETEEVLAQ